MTYWRDRYDEMLEALKDAARELQRIADNQYALCDESLTDMALVDWTVLHVALGAIAKAEEQEDPSDA